MKKRLSLIFTLTTLAVASLHSSVTFNVKVPSGTKKCYVCGDFNGWDAGAALEMTSSGTDLFTLTVADKSTSDVAKGYKYLCGQDWSYVEKDASGNEISNRTSIGKPDVVGSWYNVPEWDVVSAEITVNGVPRLIKVYLPEGYDQGTESFPVIYYNTVQQRYNNAGDDADMGDYFFGGKSWNAHATMESLRATGVVRPYIMVQICSLLGENTPESNPDFIGTGGAGKYLDAFVAELMPYVEGKWRVKKGPENTVIVGADYGALFSLYAAMQHPELFGRCVAMSPMLWINNGAFGSLVEKASASQTYYITAGTAEPQWMQSEASALAELINGRSAASIRYTLFPGATHDDEAWGASFGSILSALDNNRQPEPVAFIPAFRKKAADSIPFDQGVYTLYAGADKDNLQKIGPFVYTADYRKKGTDTPVAAFVNTNTVGLEFKSTYYWNIACGEDASAGWLLDGVKDIGFSSKKSEVSWQNVAIFEDGTVSDIAAHSKGFRLVTSDATTTMSQADPYLAYVTAAFPGKDKTFKINFGSVNSSSDMGAVTPELSVSDNCVEAYIQYDFNLNKVTVTETKFGESIDNLVVTSFTATPAVCTAGSEVRLNLALNAPGDVEVTCRKDFSQNVDVNVVKDTDTTYHIDLKDTQAGIYTFSVTLVAGSTRQPNAAEINVKVLSETTPREAVLTVNAYKDVNWETTGRYKANFHTHTSQSFDTQYTTSQVVDKYQAAGYSILSLTDHDANSYPWSMFSLYNQQASDRNSESMGMLAVPGVELSKDRRNNWSEKTGGEFNHHNDFFTGRKGQEFMSLRESYAYTDAIGGLQIINHPGQYWNLSTNYAPGEKNSPEWHAENFMLYPSLIGLEVYNQGNRRPNDRILWDRILSKTMPQRPVWGYSCDDTHTAEQYFRNYQFMLMPELSTDALKEAMTNGTSIFSYEYTGSGEAKAPHVNSITVDEENHIITINTDDAETIEWISSTHRTDNSNVSTTKSSVVGLGNRFDYSGFQGSYVRVRLVNKYGETALQPFGFDVSPGASNAVIPVDVENMLTTTVNAAERSVSFLCSEGIERVTLFNTAGMMVKYTEHSGQSTVSLPLHELPAGVYVGVVATPKAAYTAKFILN